MKSHNSFYNFIGNNQQPTIVLSSVGKIRPNFGTIISCSIVDLETILPCKVFNQMPFSDQDGSNIIMPM